MRNREQIYGQEAAGLLRNITVYHCIRRDQLLRLYPGKEGVIENLLRYTNHYEAKKLRDCKASAHIPEWRKSPVFSPAPKQTEQPIKSKKVPSRRSEFVKTDKDSIMSTKM